MSVEFVSKIASEMKLAESQVMAAASLLSDGATVPFIVRYRKEATGCLDEVTLIKLRNRLEQFDEMVKRRETIVKSLEERKLLTEELSEKIAAADSLTVLEDIFLPFRPKRRTRAILAREKGLEPLALALLEQATDNVAAEVKRCIGTKKSAPDPEDALQGARDIIAEMISEDADVRARLRELFLLEGLLESKVVKGKDTDGVKYRDYFNWREPAAATPSHRVLAMFRGEKEGVLSLRIAPPEEAALALVAGKFIRGNGAASEQVALAIQDSYKRLLGPAMEEEIRDALKRRADAEAIRAYSETLRELLMAPPLGAKHVMALDPGHRSGCRLVCLDRKGALLHEDSIQPNAGSLIGQESAAKVLAYCARFQIEAIAIANNATGRETEAFVRTAGLPPTIAIMLVDDSAATMFAESETGAEEFGLQDNALRRAVSIGRRLQDPLMELAKLDPKAIGVGQYQQDVDQDALTRGLEDVVISCVNAVGVNVNTAGKYLLSRVSGLSANLAGHILNYRLENGPLTNRLQLRKVNRLGIKAYEQCAGFLRIQGGENPLDASAIHPESYALVEKMAADLRCSVADLMRDEALRHRIELEKYAGNKAGMPTLRDILEELGKPGNDPRPRFESFSFAENVHSMEDLKPGMRLPGIITNVTAFGAFVDIGVHQDGLIHISQLADRFVRDPNEVVKIHQQVVVTVMDMDIPRKRISLSMRTNPMQSHDNRAMPQGPGQPQNGDHKPALERRPGAPERNGFAPPPPQAARPAAEQRPAERTPSPSATPRLFGPPPSPNANRDEDEPDDNGEYETDNEEMFEAMEPPAPQKPPKPTVDLTRYLEQIPPKPAPQLGPRKTPKHATLVTTIAPRKSLASEEVKALLIEKYRQK